jgi:Ca2+/Na+ antiporter
MVSSLTEWVLMLLFVVLCVLWVLSNYLEAEETEEPGRRAALKWSSSSSSSSAQDRSPCSVKANSAVKTSPKNSAVKNPV